MVEVFKTNVRSIKTSEALLQQLREHFPSCKINFDLDDCDNILRIEGNLVCTKTVSEILSVENYSCELLE